MTEQNGKVDRRTLIKMMGAAGASATVITACGDQSVSGQRLTGAEFDKTVRLATAGPGGNQNWQPGYTPPPPPPPKTSRRGGRRRTRWRACPRKSC